MDFEPTACPDCLFPPDFVVVRLADKNGCPWFAVKCRDCGDSWSEPAEIFSENIDDSVEDE